MNRGTLDALIADRRAGRAVVLATRLDSGEQVLVRPWDDTDGDLLQPARTASRQDRSQVWEGWFLRVYNPPLRMVIVGAVHIAQHLAPMAARTGFDVVVVDPRRAWATEDRFPGVALNTDWPEQAFSDLQPDRRTAVVTLTHDAKVDDPALQAALRSSAFYVGALGSTRTRAKREQRLRDAGFTDDDLSRIHGPVGLDIGARSTAEIAVAVLAQVVSVLRGGSV